MYSLILHGKGLQKWRNLRILSNPFSNSFSSASVVADVSPVEDGGRKGHNFTISYLVDSLGLTTKLAESISRKVSFEEKSNPDSVLNLLRSHGFTDSQISSVVSEYPRLLILDAEKSIGPKLKFLQSREGVSISELTEIVSTVPKILARSGDKTVSRYYDFAKESIVADKSSKLENSSSGSKQENKMRNLSVLRELGVSQERLFSLLTSNGGPVHGKERFEESLMKVIEMGFDPRTSKFLRALQVLYQMNDKTVEERVGFYKKLGFDVEDVWEMFRKHPIYLSLSEKKITQKFESMKKCGLVDEGEVCSVVKKYPQCIGISEEKIEKSIKTFLGLGFTRDEFATMVKSSPCCIRYSVETVKKKTEFLVKKMNWPLKALVSRPQVFGYSMEKRIVPRCNVIKALIMWERSEIPPISSVLACSNEVFLNRYVKKHKDEDLVTELMAIFTQKQTNLVI